MTTGTGTRSTGTGTSTGKGSRRVGRSRAPRVVLLLAVGAVVVAFGPHPEGSLPSEELGDHGAMAMDAQRDRVRELLPQRDVTLPPPEVDAELWEFLVPGDNAMNAERVALGEALYFDVRLSRDGTVACATCHDVSRGFTDQRPVSEGAGGALGRRNAPTTMNAFFYQSLFLDGRVPSLESQAGFPPINSVEGGHPDRASVIAAIADDPKLQKMFRAAYGSGPNYEDMERAIAAYERTLVFMDSPLDAFLAGQSDAISDSAKRGWALYNGKARCVGCHQIFTSNSIGTDNLFHNIGVAARTQNFEQLADQALEALREGGGADAVDELALKTNLSELGRFLVTKDRADIGAFKTQGIRNVGVTAPYMHDGSMRTLWDVMDHYNKGGEANPFLDGGIEPLALSEQEIDDVVALLFSMTDRRFAEQNQAELEQQRTIAAERRPFRDEALAMRRTLPFEQRVMGGGSAGASAEEGSE
jgi:cytochrome c peroxidase